MSRGRIQKLFIAAILIALIAVAGIQFYFVADLLACYLVFSIFFAALAITILALFLLGEGVVRCYELVVAHAASVRLRQALPPVVVPVTHGIGRI